MWICILSILEINRREKENFNLLMKYDKQKEKSKRKDNKFLEKLIIRMENL